MFIKLHMHLQGRKVLNTHPLDSKANFCFKKSFGQGSQFVIDTYEV
jgi:hypothetical protein